MRLSIPGVLMGLLLANTPVLALGEALPMQVGHTIEHKMDSCMEEGEWASQAMFECAEIAHGDWQEEVERLESRLAGRLGSDTREALETAQHHWEASRDTDFAFITTYYADLQRADPAEDDDAAGEQLWPLAEQLRRNAVLEDRASQLQRYLNGLEELPHRPDQVLEQ